MINQVLQGDCLEVLKGFPENYFDSLLIDPPAGIAFMGKDWDKDKKGMLNWINWLSEIMVEVKRTLKPGAIGLVWSIPRTSHWTGMALDLAGFRLIDVIHHANGSGFPKAQDISTQIDQLLGEEREVIGTRLAKGGENLNQLARVTGNDNSQAKGCGAYGIGAKQINIEIPVTAPATDEAKQWDGWKTPALKPAIEGWWLIQKPISESSIARNILTHGVGGLNIEEGRIGSETRVNASKARAERNGFVKGFVTGTETEIKNYGRYPANLVLSCGANCDGENHSPDCPVTVIGDQSGVSKSKSSPRGGTSPNPMSWYQPGSDGDKIAGHDDRGTAARYFKQLPFDPETATSIYYQAKASKSDRSCNGQVKNVHPTVKSRHLIGYFLKLITPPNGIVLDCFGGSGTTAIAAIENGFNYILIEKEPEYIEIINQRIATTTGTAIANPVPTNKSSTQQLNLFDVA